MFKAASKDRISAALHRIADDIGAARISPKEATLRLHRVKMALSQTAEQALEAMGPIQADSREEVMKGFKSANPDLTDKQLEEIADQWEKNKDVVKDKTAGFSTSLGEVIESKRWTHKETGATASLYGAVPWSGAKGDTKADWKLDVVGYTIQWADGKIGMGRQPFKTEKEAEDFLKKETERRGKKA